MFQVDKYKRINFCIDMWNIRFHKTYLNIQTYMYTSINVLLYEFTY